MQLELFAAPEAQQGELVRLNTPVNPAWNVDAPGTEGFARFLETVLEGPRVQQTGEFEVTIIGWRRPRR